MDSITQEQAEGLVQEWKEALRRTHWTTKIVMVPNLDTVARCRILSWKYKEAIISICTPETISVELLCLDPEVSIVHEILHLFTKGFSDLIDDDTWEDDAVEEMVEMIAQALVFIKRTAVHHQLVKEELQRQLLAVLPKSSASDSDSYVKDNYTQKIILGVPKNNGRRPKAA